MKKFLICLLAVSVLSGCQSPVPSQTETPEPTKESVDTQTGATSDSLTSASVVADELVKTYAPKGFSDYDSEKALVIVGDPRHYSVTWDLANITMVYLEERGMEVELRDLYAMSFNPVLAEEDFYYAKDGKGKPNEVVAAEQALVSRADHIIFVYPNWHDSEIAIVKGYKEMVFAKQFAYADGENGLEGLLKGKTMYTIMNCGYLGGGRGWIGDGFIDSETWDAYMNAYNVFDEDTANFWGVEHVGRFMNDRTPSNESENYAQELKELEDALCQHLDQVYFR